MEVFLIYLFTSIIILILNLINKSHFTNKIIYADVMFEVYFVSLSFWSFMVGMMRW